MSPLGGPPRLETDRLVLRPRSVDDAEVVRRMWTERDPRVPAHRRIDGDGRPTVADVGAGIVRAEADAAGARLLSVVRKQAGDVIGYCGLLPSDGAPDEAELAYELLRVAQGRGYATEAATAVVGWAREAGYRRLTAGVWDWNVASRRVLAKLGFHETGDGEPTSEDGRTVRTVLEL